MKVFPERNIWSYYGIIFLALAQVVRCNFCGGLVVYWGDFMDIAVVDGQGGGIGKIIIEKIRDEFRNTVEILAIGTNSQATSVMLRAGANEGATGESALICNVDQVDLIVGSLSIILPNSMRGELTAKMAKRVVVSKARKLLLPLHRNNLDIVGLHSEPLPHMVDALVSQIKQYMENEGGNRNVRG